MFKSKGQIPFVFGYVVFVRKASNKFHMCVDFTDLNVTCPKDTYPLHKIGHLSDRSSGYKMLSFTDIYLGYNYIKMDPIDAPKIEFIFSHGNYYYNLMPFRFKNVNATY